MLGNFGNFRRFARTPENSLRVQENLAIVSLQSALQGEKQLLAENKKMALALNPTSYPLINVKPKYGWLNLSLNASKIKCKKPCINLLHE